MDNLKKKKTEKINKPIIDDKYIDNVLLKARRLRKKLEKRLKADDENKDNPLND